MSDYPREMCTILVSHTGDRFDQEALADLLLNGCADDLIVVASGLGIAPTAR